MSAIRWLTCPACKYRFYIIDEQGGLGYLWFCPSCKHEFRENEQPTAPAATPRAASM
jgi:uncharacterized protein YbaR (Trm112 family)